MNNIEEKETKRHLNPFYPDFEQNCKDIKIELDNILQTIARDCTLVQNPIVDIIKFSTI